MEKPKCHNCNGKGMVQQDAYRSKCYYCRGKGWRDTYYGIDKSNM